MLLFGSRWDWEFGFCGNVGPGSFPTRGNLEFPECSPGIPQWEFRFDISWVCRDSGISHPGVIPRDPNPKSWSQEPTDGRVIHLGMPRVGCSSPIPSGTPLSLPERQGSKIHPFGMSKASLDKDRSHLGLWNAWSGTGLKIWDSLQWEILFLFPWVSRDGREGSRASHSMKTGISRGKSVLPAQFSSKRIPWDSGGQIQVGASGKTNSIPLFFPEQPHPTPGLIVSPPNPGGSHRKNSLWLPVFQGIAWNLLWITRACLIHNNAQSTVIPKEML